MVFSTLSEPIRRALQFAGYREPTPIQAKAIPPLLEGKDLLGIAQTGTGKTAAFLLPILEYLSSRKAINPSGTPRALVLAPTRELAAQIDESCERYGKHLRVTHTVIFGGVKQGNQVKALQRGVDVLVATPGRLLDLMEQGFIHLDKLEIFVLDEADRMLDMGFLPDVKRVVRQLPPRRQTMFFSATMAPEIGELAASMLTEPVRVEVAPEKLTVEAISQRVLFVDQQKKDALLWLLLERDLEKVLVFTRTKHRADKVARLLKKRGVAAAAIHGNRSQNQREQALNAFHKGRARVLVATDIAARGIDVKDISHVINFDLPNEPENYVHRIGRTARAGKDGVAYSFCSGDEKYYLRAIQKIIKMKIDVEQHPFHSTLAENDPGLKAPPRGGRAPQKQFREVKPRFARAKSGGAPRGKPKHTGAVRGKPSRTGAPRTKPKGGGARQKQRPPRGHQGRRR